MNPVAGQPAHPEATYCAWCGRDVADGPAAHERCRQRLALVDPPRYCTRCARRMVVQVTPAGWHAICSRHGRLAR